MTNSDVFVCGCQGSGETIDKALQNVNVEGIRFVSAQRACRDGIATVLDAKNKTSGARCFRRLHPRASRIRIFGR